MKQLAIISAVILVALLFVIELAVEIEHYFEISKYKAGQTEEMKKISSEYETALQKFVECAGFRSIDLVVKSGDDLFFTNIGGFVALARKRVPVIVSLKRFEMVKHNSKYLKIMIAHELAHHILDPTIYHYALTRLFFQKVVSELNESFVETVGNRVYHQCISF